MKQLSDVCVRRCIGSSLMLTQPPHEDNILETVPVSMGWTVSPEEVQQVSLSQLQCDGGMGAVLHSFALFLPFICLQVAETLSLDLRFWHSPKPSSPASSFPVCLNVCTDKKKNRLLTMIQLYDYSDHDILSSLYSSLIK